MNKPKEEFYVWLMPAKKKILVDDHGNPPAACCNLGKHELELVQRAGGNRTFDNWEEAVHYADLVSKKMHWDVNYNNESGRLAEALYREELGLSENDDINDFEG